MMVDERSNLVSAEVMAKLRGLRRRLRGRLAVEGLCRLVMVCVVWGAVSLGLDCLFRLERPLRGLMLAGGVGVLLAVLWRCLVGPMLVRMSLAEMAKLVERRFGVLEDRLLSALEMAGSPPAAVSGAMLRRMAEQANECAGRLRFGEVVETRRLLRVGLAAFAGVLLVGFFSGFRPAVAGLWWERNVLLRSIDWPQETYLSVYVLGANGRVEELFVSRADGTVESVRETVEVLRGGELDVVVAAGGRVLPDSVVLHAWFPSMGQTESRLERLGGPEAEALAERLGRSGVAVYRKRFEPVREALRFHAEGGDDRRDGRREHRVVLVDPPGLEGMELSVTPPAYMRGRPTLLGGIRGVVSVPLGSRLGLVGQASKDLRSAGLLLDGQSAGQVRIEPDGQGRPRRVICSVAILGENRSTSRKLAVRLEDRDGWRNVRGEQLLVQVQPDVVPSVVLRSFGVGPNKISPRARIGLEALGRDDHGVAEVAVRYRLERPGQGESASPPAEVAWTTVGEVFSSLEPKSQQAVRRELDIEPLKLPLETRVYVCAEVADGLPGSFGGPGRGRSGTLTLRVVSVEELLAELITRQKQARMTFFQSTAEQKLLLGRCEQVLRDVRQGRAGPDVQRKLSEAMTRLQDVISDVQKVGADYATVADELEFNRIGQAGEIVAMREEVVDPLDALAERLRSSSAELQGMRNVETAEELIGRAEGLVTEQGVIGQEMDRLLKRMQRLENRLDLAHRLEGLLKMSVELEALLRKRLQQQAEDLFDPQD